jgi:hypothetical protein
MLECAMAIFGSVTREEWCVTCKWEFDQNDKKAM